MNRIKKIKKIFFPFLFSIVIILFLIVLAVQKLNKKSEESNLQQASFDNIVPGESNKEDVINNLGEPVKTSTESALPDQFKSLNPNKNNLVFYNNGKVSLIKEIITYGENKNAKEIIEKYGNPPYTLYGPDSSNGFNLYVYPDVGLAYLGNQTSGTLLEIWYFPKTNISNFTLEYAIGYSQNVRNIPQQ